MTNDEHRKMVDELTSIGLEMAQTRERYADAHARIEAIVAEAKERLRLPMMEREAADADLDRLHKAWHAATRNTRRTGAPDEWANNGLGSLSDEAREIIRCLTPPKVSP